MAIVQPAEMDFSDKKFSMIISGPPGIGKTTLALSAPNPVLIDFDRGISRVKAQHRKITSVIDTYEELLQDMESTEFKKCETIVLDTGGSFVTYLQDWAMRQDTGNRKKSGGISMQGFGAVKSEFVRFTNNLKDVLNKNIIYIFHTQEEKAKDGSIIQRLLCEGSARNIVWQPCDLGCFMQIINGERVLGFTPTDEYFAKGCFGIKGMISVPELKENMKNDFITKLFESAKNSIREESKIFETGKVEYEKAINAVRKIISNIKDAESASEATEKMKVVKHSLTSEREGKAAFKDKLKELGLTWDKEAGKYV